MSSHTRLGISGIAPGKDRGKKTSKRKTLHVYNLSKDTLKKSKNTFRFILAYRGSPSRISPLE